MQLLIDSKLARIVLHGSSSWLLPAGDHRGWIACIDNNYALYVATGRCECGGVRYEVDGELRDVWNCHCGRCRRITGHHMAGTRVANVDLTVYSGDPLRWYSPEPSVAYGFCCVCGASLFWKVVGSEHTSICAGTLDQPTGLITTAAWWVTEHADYHPRLSGLAEHDYDG